MYPYSTWWAPYIKSGCKMKMALFIIVISISWLGEQDIKLLCCVMSGGPLYLIPSIREWRLKQYPRISLSVSHFDVVSNYWLGVFMESVVWCWQAFVCWVTSELGYIVTFPTPHVTCVAILIFSVLFSHSCLQIRALRKCFFSQMVEGRKATETTSCPKGD